MKSSAIAPSNIAFTKYWGKSNDELTLPLNDSISMSLSDLTTHTTVEFSDQYKEDEVSIGDSEQGVAKVSGEKAKRVIEQLNRLKKIAKIKTFAKVVSKNTFPTGVGIASSASAFAALTKAAVDALGVIVSDKELSILTRLAGSGSAARSVFGGFVKWNFDHTSEGSFSEQILDEKSWLLEDTVVITSTKEKGSSSLEGHSSARTSPYLQARLADVEKRNRLIDRAIRNKNLKILGEEMEKDMLSLHFMAMSSVPPIFYWNGATVEVLAAVRSLRDNGTPVYATIDAGPNVHLIYEKSTKTTRTITEVFKDVPGVTDLIFASVGKGVKSTDKHLF